MDAKDSRVGRSGYRLGVTVASWGLAEAGPARTRDGDQRSVVACSHRRAVAVVVLVEPRAARNKYTSHNT